MERLRRSPAPLWCIAIATMALFGCPEPSSAARAPAQLQWRPPSLEEPTHIQIDGTDPTIELQAGHDYVIELPERTLSMPKGVSLNGGRNVVLIGGHIDVPPSVQVHDERIGRALNLRGQTGTVHIEGLRITGDGLNEGIDVEETTTTVVQLQAIRVTTVHYPEGMLWHPDVVQTLNGPRILRMDGLFGTTQYQGFFFGTPQGAASPGLLDLRRVFLQGRGPRAAFSLWQDPVVPINISRVAIDEPGKLPRQLLYPTPRDWRGVRFGPLRGRDARRLAGLSGGDYKSPGYVGVRAERQSP